MLRAMAGAMRARAPASSALCAAAGEAAWSAAPRWAPAPGGDALCGSALPPAARALLAATPRGVKSAAAPAGAALCTAPVWPMLRFLCATAHCAAAEGASALPSPPRSRARTKAAPVRAADLPAPPAAGAGGHAGDAAQVFGGAVLGFCTGYALKQAGRTLALLIGFGFLSAQVAAAAGVATPAPHAALRLAWRRLCEASGLPRDAAALRAPSPAKLAAHCHALLVANAAAAAGFAPGLYLGLRSG